MNGRFRKGTNAFGMSKVIGRSRLPCPPTSTTALIAGLAYTKFVRLTSMETGNPCQPSPEARSADQRGEGNNEQAEHGGENGKHVHGEPDGPGPLRPHRLRGG